MGPNQQKSASDATSAFLCSEIFNAKHSEQLHKKGRTLWKKRAQHFFSRQPHAAADTSSSLETFQKDTDTHKKGYPDRGPYWLGLRAENLMNQGVEAKELHSSWPWQLYGNESPAEKGHAILSVVDSQRVGQ